MNFDKLKQDWDNQNLPPKKVQIKKVNNLPLSKFRNNVFKDIWVQSISMFLIAFFPFIFGFDPLKTNLFYMIYAPFVLISFYFLLNMYLFYKKSQNYNMNSKDALYETYYEVRLYIQNYESFSFSLVPFMFILFWIILADTDSLNELEISHIIISIGSFIVYLVILTVLAKVFWMDRLYNRYLKQIKSTLEYFRENDENDFE